ncbi:penicillin-binding protein activator [Parvularcula sp. ZS-1/3]|uniref:Penicillin-binding protein activator n=1 Tax=Parvularcula mediterranea TaxID=2732508 RepID=A0A7Y3RM46_9PROT|nr:penicillin-binding protein activator [Parvularcula mediterranea]NNU16125.1 penicillin-binding protein activator [Parvularcula mediterranea]
MTIAPLSNWQKRLAALGLVLFAAACSTTGGGPGKTDDIDPVATEDPVGLEEPITLPDLDEDRVVRVALLLPLNDQRPSVQDLAESMLKAAQMVAFESGNKSFLLIPEDTKGTPQGARIAAQNAIRGGADIILGPLFASSVDAISPIARAQNIPVVAFSTDRRVSGDGVYLLSFPPEPEIERVTQYALSQGYARFGLLAPLTEYGSRVSDAFREQIYVGGGQLVHEEVYERTPDSMRAPAARLAEFAAPGFIPQYVKPRGPRPIEDRLRPDEDDLREPPATVDRYGPRISNDDLADPIGRADVPSETYDPAYDGFQAVLLPESGRLLRALAPLLPYNDVDVREIKLLGVSAWNNPGLKGEPALRGGWFAAPDPQRSRGFNARYRAAYGETAPRLASLAYDATLIAARLAESKVPNPYSEAMLTNPNGFIGADGLFRLTPEGMVERGLAILEIGPGGIVVIDEAPLSFKPDPYAPKF